MTDTSVVHVEVDDGDNIVEVEIVGSIPGDGGGGGGGDPGLAARVTTIEARLGSDPEGVWADLTERLNAMEDRDGIEAGKFARSLSVAPMVADAVEITGVTIVAGNAVVPWSAAAASMQGKAAILAGAGPSNTNLVTTVQSVVAGSSITLAAAPSTARPAGSGYGIVGTDNTNTMAQMLSWLKVFGTKLIVRGPGDYLFNGSVHTTSTANSGGLDIEGTRGVRFFHASATATWLSGGGTAYANVNAVSVASAVHASSQTLAATTGLTVDSYVYVRDASQPIVSGPDATTSAVTGECMRIKSIVGNVVTYYSPLRNAYTTAATVSSFFPMRYLRISNIEFVNPVPLTGNGSNALITVSSVMNLDINECTFRKMDCDSIRLARVIDSRCRALNFYDHSNYLDVHLDGTTTLGYALKVAGGCQDLLLEGITGRRGRHLITSVANPAESPAQDVYVSDSRGRDFTSSTFDTHPGAERWVFDNCHAVRGQTGQLVPPGETGEAGFQIRGRWTVVSNCSVDGHRYGVELCDAADSCTVYNLTTRNITGFPYYLQSSDDCVIDGGHHELGKARGLLWVTEDSSLYLNHVQKLSIDNVLGRGNPSGAALEFDLDNERVGIWRNGFHIGRNVRCPDATTMSSASRAAVTVNSAATLTIPTNSDEVRVLGTTNITNAVCRPGDFDRIVTLTFAGVLTVSSGAALALASDYVTSADAVLVLKAEGTKWVEVSRSKLATASVAEGAGIDVSFDSGSGVLTIAAPRILRQKAAPEVRNNTTTFANDSELTFASGVLETGHTYKMTAHLIHQGLATDDIKFQLTTLPAGATMESIFWRVATNVAATPWTPAPQRAINNAGGPSGNIDASTPTVTRWDGLLKMGGTAGAVTLQWAQNSASGTDTTLLAGSYILFERIT